MSNTIEQRPWGSFEVLAEGEGYKVKKIIVNPGQRLSLQSHEKRDEIWVVVENNGIFDSGVTLTRTTGNQAVRIPRNFRHRLTNDGKLPLVIIETQLGICDENDITRYEDDYGRIEGK